MWIARVLFFVFIVVFLLTLLAAGELPECRSKKALTTCPSAASRQRDFARSANWQELQRRNQRTPNRRSKAESYYSYVTRSIVAGLRWQ
jgi:hypothetical protein